MDMDDDGVADPTAEFGELFEGQVAFESELGDHDADEMLGSIGSDMAMGPSTHHHRSSHHPSDHDILEANLPFVPDDYLQHHQHIVMDSDMGNISSLGGLEDSQHQLQGLEDRHRPDEYSQPRSNSQNQTSKLNSTTSSGAAILQNFNQVPETSAGHNMSLNTTVPPGKTEGPAVKKKVKVLKDVKYFACENMERYLKRRGFKMKNGVGDSTNTTKSVSKAVFALSCNSQNRHNKLFSYGSKYHPEHIVPEIERFWKFYLSMKTKNTAISMELLPMLIPMLLHFYFEMMLANVFPIARRICMEFSKKFLHEDKTQEHYDVLVAVTKITSVDMLKSDSILSPLLNRRCEFFISELTLLHLRRFLAASLYPVLPSLITGRFKIRARETKDLMESFDWEKMLDSEDESEEAADKDVGDDNDNGNAKSERNGITDEERYVQHVIDEVRNSVCASLPSISVYTTVDDPVCGAISKQGSLVAFGLSEAGIRLYSIENARNILTTHSEPDELTDPESFYGARYLGGHTGPVCGVHFHPRTKLLFSVGQDSFMRAWDLNTQDQSKCRAVYRGHSGPIWKLDMPESGSMVATCGMDTTARIFLPERTEYVRSMAGHYFSVNTVKFHPNEAYIATGSDDRSARLWSVHDGNLVRMFTGSAGSITCLAFHSSGKYLAGAGEDKKIILWDLAEGEVLATLNSLENCTDLLFSGSMLSACFRNGKLQIFNLRPILGGRESTFQNSDSCSSIHQPFTTETTAKSLIKVFYKNPGTLYCLGSELKGNEDCITKERKAGPIFKANETSSKAAENTSERFTNSGSNLLQHVLQTSIPNPALSQASEVTKPTTGNSNVGSTSRILAARLSQPIPSCSSSVVEEGEVTNLLLSEGEDPPSVGTSAATSSAPMISSSELDAAIASVIDQSGGDHSTGGGTITMYASN